jgi:hypothetical protein
MQCWVSQEMDFDDEQAETHLREAWEHESGKDEMNVVLQGLEQHFWRETEAGWLGCYDFAGETLAGDGVVYKCAMGAGSVCLQRPGCSLIVRVGSTWTTPYPSRHLVESGFTVTQIEQVTLPATGVA